MKNVLLFFTGMMLMGLVQAQNSRFITIDAENMQPFSVLLGKKVYSSSSVGHLVMPNLPDSSIILQFNFPQNKYKEHTFLIAADSRDRGFQLKKTGVNDWALFDWQSLELLQPVAEKQPESEVPPGAELRSDGFARLMAAVVNDSAILVNDPPKASVAKKVVVVPATPAQVISEKTVSPEMVADTLASPIVKKAPPAVVPPVVDTVAKEAAVIVSTNPVTVPDTVTKAIADSAGSAVVVVSKVNKTPDSVVDIRNADRSPILKKEPAIDPVIVKNEVQEKPVPKAATIQAASMVRKIFDNTGKEWRDQRYRDSTETGVDTITIKIPLENEVSIKPSQSAQTVISLPEERKPVVDTISKVLVKEVTQTQKDTVVATTPKLVMVNSDCRAVATDNDLDKLRVKMLAETGVEERVLVARKAFKAKCYNTRQIKALTELFFTDESRYQFLDAAYPFVIDTDNFKSLVELLTDAYYINRFKAMVRM